MSYGKNTLLSVLFCAFPFVNAYAISDVVPQVHDEIHRQLRERQEEASYFFSLVDSVGAIEGQIPFELYPEFDLDLKEEVAYEGFDSHQPAIPSQVEAYNYQPTYPTNKSANNAVAGRSNSYEAPSSTRDVRPQATPGGVNINLSGWYPPIKGMITSPFGWRKKRMHKGEDIKLYVGDTVKAAFDGVVRTRSFDRRGYGYYYVLSHSNGLETVYGHLSGFIAPENAYVKAGQPIGLGGSTGRSTGPHLHFEMRYKGIPLNPSKLINFNTFQPHNTIYKVNIAQAEWDKDNEGRGGSSSISDSSSDQADANARRARNARNKKEVSSRERGGASAYHTIKRGDCLGSVARRYGTTVSRICQLNHLKSNATLHVGQKIRYK